VEESKPTIQHGILVAFGTVLPFPVYWYMLTYYRWVFFPGDVSVSPQITQGLDYLAAGVWPLLAWHAAIQFILLKNGRIQTAFYAACLLSIAVPVGLMATVIYAQQAGVG